MNGRRDVSLTEIPNIGRATLIGMGIGWLVVGIPVLVAMLALGARGDVVWFASHVGSFGGMGFGGMLGAVIQADRFERGTTGKVLDVAPDRHGGAHGERVDHAA